MGEMPEEVSRGPDTQPLELLRAALADSLEELDRHVEPQGAATRGFQRCGSWSSLALLPKAGWRPG